MKYKKDWLFSDDEYICGVRSAGVLIRNGKILVQRDLNGCEYALLGGHIKIGETTEVGLIREFKEETGADILCSRFLWSEECFWEWNGKKAHTITFYYLIKLCKENDIPDKGEFVSHKDNSGVVFGWIPLDKVKDIKIYPEFLKREIFDLNGDFKHFISK